MSGKISQHLLELEGWRRDRILSDHEFDGLRKSYGRLIEKEDAWIMEVRRLSLPQVSLYLGAWVLVVGAALIFLFRYLGLSGTLPVLLVIGVSAARRWAGGVGVGAGAAGAAAGIGAGGGATDAGALPPHAPRSTRSVKRARDIRGRVAQLAGSVTRSGSNRATAPGPRCRS